MSHESYMRLALSLAKNSPPQPTNFRVGAVLVNPATNSILSTGYTLELPGNTHAEQVCLMKLADKYACSESEFHDKMLLLDGNDKDTNVKVDLYTTMEPCVMRLSGNKPCVDRILDTKGWIGRVFVGVREPDTFVGENVGIKKLEQRGIEVCEVPGLEEEILEVATMGHHLDQ